MAATIPVLIVGAGPVGLGLALELAGRGIDCMVADDRDGSVGIPKMTAVTARTMEFCRRWGIAGEVEQAGWPADHPQDFVYVTALTGHELFRAATPPFSARAESHITPHGNIHCPQIYFDPIMQRHAAAHRRISLVYHTSLDGFTANDGSVSARLTDPEGGRQRTVVARYLVGCDGAESTVRRALGIAMAGEGALSNSISIYFKSAELGRVHDKGWARFYRMVDGRGHWADLVSIDGYELWRLTVFRHAAGDAVDVPGIFRQTIGVEFPYEVLSILPWERRELVAAGYGSGRVFIAGDAAHQLSPTGGLGMNTGLADGVDLGWKLAATLDGWGGAGLLASYEAERKPMAWMNVRKSTEYYRRTTSLPKGHAITEDSPEGARQRKAFGDALRAQTENQTIFISEHVKLGYTYEGSPITVADGTPAPPDSGLDYIPNARPGARAPHVWLADGRSTLDLFGDGFTLLRLGGGAPVAGPLQRAAAKAGVPLAAVELDDAAVVEIYGQALVLVRPDGHVAWRGDTLPAEPASLIDRVRGVRA
jgi:2-polyprenyl-6-methoxyphenol hydroxylase-like FAD-dependent oxidoreductase